MTALKLVGKISMGCFAKQLRPVSTQLRGKGLSIFEFGPELMTLASRSQDRQRRDILSSVMYWPALQTGYWRR